MTVNKSVTTDNNLLDVNIVKINSENELCSLYYSGSKSKEDVGVGCLLLDVKANKIFISRRLEFECTYEALLQGI